MQFKTNVTPGFHSSKLHVSSMYLSHFHCQRRLCGMCAVKGNPHEVLPVESIHNQHKCNYTCIKTLVWNGSIVFSCFVLFFVFVFLLFLSDWAIIRYENLIPIFIVTDHVFSHLQFPTDTIMKVRTATFFKPFVLKPANCRAPIHSIHFDQCKSKIRKVTDYTVSVVSDILQLVCFNFSLLCIKIRYI